jgi:hypothetical protein
LNAIRNKPLQSVAAGLLVVLVLGFQGAYLANFLSWPNAPDRGYLNHFIDLGPHIVAQTRPLGEEAGLRAGDRILTVNTLPFETFAEYLEILDWELGHVNEYRVRRGAEELTIDVPVEPLGWGIVLRHQGPTVILGVLFLGLSVLIFSMKPFTRVTWAFLSMTSSLAMMSWRPSIPRPPKLGSRMSRPSSLPSSTASSWQAPTSR